MICNVIRIQGKKQINFFIKVAQVTNNPTHPRIISNQKIHLFI